MTSISTSRAFVQDAYQLINPSSNRRWWYECLKVPVFKWTTAFICRKWINENVSKEVNMIFPSVMLLFSNHRRFWLCSNAGYLFWKIVDLETHGLFRQCFYPLIIEQGMTFSHLNILVLAGLPRYIVYRKPIWRRTSYPDHRHQLFIEHICSKIWLTCGNRINLAMVRGKLRRQIGLRVEINISVIR